MNKPTDYKILAWWGHRLGSSGYYIKLEQDSAAHDNAPLDAIYKRDGTWVTLRDCDNREAIENAVRSGLIERYPDSGVRVAIFTVTVMYHETGLDPKECSLGRIAEEIVHGEFLGQVKNIADVDLNIHQARRRCEEMGSDPSFFGLGDIPVKCLYCGKTEVDVCQNGLESKGCPRGNT